jgi:hypothetical protein
MLGVSRSASIRHFALRVNNGFFREARYTMPSSHYHHFVPNREASGVRRDVLGGAKIDAEGHLWRGPGCVFPILFLWIGTHSP